jgi:hypothetical protein
VTDLGTEFGVEVNDRGNTLSYVFRGSVEVQASASRQNTTAKKQVLIAGESVQVTAASPPSRKSSENVMAPVPINPQRFVREVHPDTKKALPLQVVSWFRMGEDDPGAMTGGLANATIVNHIRSKRYYLKRLGTPRYTSNTGAPGSSLAMSFTAKNKDRFIASHWGISPNDDFILEAWVRVRKIVSEYEIVVYNGDTRHNGYGLLIKDARWHLMFGDIMFADSQIECKPGRWTHLGLVCEHGETVLWIDGRPTKAIWHGVPTLPDGVLQIGCSSKPDEPNFFDGEIDEIRMSALRGAFQPEMLLLPNTMLLDNLKQSHKP